MAEQESLAEVARDLRALRDHQQIVECLHRYSRGIDRCDVDLVVSCFHDDAVQDTGFSVGSPRAWAEMVNEFHLGQALCQQHHVTNHVVDIDGDVAHVESYYLATVREKAGTTKFAGGRWVDRFERRAGQWRIALRISTTETIVDVPTTDMTTADQRFVPWTRDRTDLSYERPLEPLRDSVKAPYRTMRAGSPR
jgi:ketosteroid isomerase-like protein